MYFDGNVTFKGVTSGSLGIKVSSMPKMQHSTVKATEYDIPLRDGIQYSSWRNRTDAKITVKFAIVKDNNRDYIQTLRATRQWLEGTGELILDNNPDVYYNVKKVEITDEEMYTLSSGELEATFVVEPFEYMIDDTVIEEVIEFDADPITLTVVNDGDLCKPLIKAEPQLEPPEVTTSRFGAKIKIDNLDNSQIEFPSGPPIHPNIAYIDTDLMYTYGNVYHEGVLNFERYFTHDYDSLWIPSGSHTITLEPSTNAVEHKTKVTIYLRRGYAI